MQAHQWFGNLATLDDWNELWINEGFATYFEAVLADAYQPGMGYLNNFFADTTSNGKPLQQPQMSGAARSNTVTAWELVRLTDSSHQPCTDILCHRTSACFFLCRSCGPLYTSKIGVGL